MKHPEWRAKFVDVGEKSDIMDTMETGEVRVKLKGSAGRFVITQEMIDDVLQNELSEFDFPVKPIYNPRIRSNGRTVAVLFPGGRFKELKSIEIGKQDRPGRRFLVDTLLHEYYEAKIYLNQNFDSFYNALTKASDDKRHEWINGQIAEFFRRKT